jgi:hypothetical protein
MPRVVGVKPPKQKRQLQNCTNRLPDYHPPQFSWAPARVHTYIGRWVFKEYLMLCVKPSLSTSADVPPRIRPYSRGSQYVCIVVKKTGGRARNRVYRQQRLG